MIAGPPAFPESRRGTLADVPTYLERLVRSPDDTATLVIQVVDAEPFLQFTGGRSGVQLAFPLITSAQRAREQVIRRFFDARNLHIRSTFGSDGAGFIDIDLPADAAFLAKISDAAFDEIFEARAPLELEFMGERLGVGR